MPGTGFEPAHLAAPPPEDGASTNFATRADANYREANIEKLLIQLKLFSVFVTSTIYCM